MIQHTKTFVRSVIDYAKWRLNGRPIASPARPVTVGDWYAVFGSLSPTGTRSGDPLLCILLCDIFSAEDVARTIEMQLAQTSDAWKMTVLVRASDGTAMAEVINAVSPHDARIDVCAWDPAVDSPARKVDELIGGESGSHVLLLGHGSALAPTAVEWFRFSCRDADLVYADEILASGHDPVPVFKPGWSPTLAATTNYVGSSIAVRRTTFEQVGGFGRGLHDLVMRLAEYDAAVCHLPNLLIERFEDAAVPCDDMALSEAVRQRSSNAVVTPRRSGGCTIEWSGAAAGSVKVVIPTRDRVDLLHRSVDSVLKASGVPNLTLVIVDNGSQQAETLSYLDEAVRLDDRVSVVRDHGPFNFSRVCNAGAAHGDPSDVIVFLNNDVSARDTRWLRQLVGWFEGDRVAAVGARLEFPDGRVQHMGVVVGRDQFLGDDVPSGHVPLAAHLGHGLRPDQIVASTFDSQREVGALTAACIAVDAGIFEGVGGFDEELGIDFQDVDLCLKMTSLSGLSLIYDPSVILEHVESASRGSVGASAPETLELMTDRWSGLLEAGDPFFNPHLALDLTLRPVQDLDLEESMRRVAPRLAPGMSYGG